MADGPVCGSAPTLILPLAALLALCIYRAEVKLDEASAEAARRAAIPAAEPAGPPAPAGGARSRRRRAARTC